MVTPRSQQGEETSLPPNTVVPPDTDAAHLAAENARLRAENDRLTEENAAQRAALERERGLLTAALGATSDAVLLLDGTGAILELNETAAQRLGFCPETAAESLGSSFFDHLPPENVEEHRRWFKEAEETRRPVQFKQTDGNVTWGFRLAPFTDPETNALRVALLARDVSESEAAIKALRESQARYRAILEDQTELICRYLPDGRLSYVNEAYARYYGRTPRELANTNFIPHIPDEDWDLIRARVAALRQENPVTTFEHRVFVASGELRWQQWTHRAIYGQSGVLTEYQAVGRDVTKRKAAEALVQAQRSFLRRIIDTVPTLIYVKDRSGAFRLVNRAMAEMYGTTVEELEGCTGADFNPNEAEMAGFRDEDLRVLDTGMPVFIPQRPITNAHGEKRWYSTTKLPLSSEELLGVAVDITERKEAEAERSRLERHARQSQKMQALGTLAGGIAHDFNNMIFAILGFTRLALKRAEPGSKNEEYLSQIQSAGQRASELVRQILTFSRQTEQEKKPVALTPILKEVAKLLRATLPSTIEIELTIAPGLEAAAEDEPGSGAVPALVLGDPIQIHQVLMNLCTNAGHAMETQGGTLAISLAEYEVGLQDQEQPDLSPGCYHLLTVADTGTGIPVEILERIYDPFFTTKPPGKGTGMGLSVVHGIVKGHHGSVQVQSAPGEGTTFKVYLPALTERSEAESLPQGTPRGGEEAILLVDDEPLLVRMESDILSELGYRVTATTSPNEALELLSRDRFDLVLTDQTMPDLTGLELAEMIAIRAPGTPVVLLTGYSEAVTPERAASSGVVEYLMKPVVDTQLAQAIRRVLDAQEERMRAETADDAGAPVDNEASSP